MPTLVRFLKYPLCSIESRLRRRLPSGFFSFTTMNCMGINSSDLSSSREYWKEELSLFITVFTTMHRYLYVPLCFIGVFSNIAIVIVLLRAAMRRNPFNVFLIVIAVCDATLMATYLVYKHVTQCHPWYFSYYWLVYTKYYAMVSVFVHALSLWLTVNMAVLRYMVLLRGEGQYLQSIPPCNTFQATVFAVLVAILLATFGSLPNMLRYEIAGGERIAVPSDLRDICMRSQFTQTWQTMRTLDDYRLVQPDWWSCEWERVNFWLASLVLKLIPSFLLTIFMTLLVRMLIEARERRSRLCGGVANGNSQAERTTTMLTGIVAVFLVTEAPQGILGLAVGFAPRLYGLNSVFGNTFDLLSLINSSVNFVLYAMMSHVFRREFLQTFGMCCPKSSQRDSGAILTKTTINRNTPVFLPLQNYKGDRLIPAASQLEVSVE